MKKLNVLARKRLVWGITILFYSAAFYGFVYPEIHVFSTKQWFLDIFQNIFGAYGFAVMWFVFGSIGVYVVLIEIDRESH